MIHIEWRQILKWPLMQTGGCALLRTERIYTRIQYIASALLLVRWPLLNETFFSFTGNISSVYRPSWLGSHGVISAQGVFLCRFHCITDFWFKLFSVKHTSCLLFGSAPFFSMPRHMSSFSSAVSQALRNTGMPSLVLLLTSAPYVRAISMHWECRSVAEMQ